MVVPESKDENAQGFDVPDTVLLTGSLAIERNLRPWSFHQGWDALAAEARHCWRRTTQRGDEPRLVRSAMTCSTISWVHSPRSIHPGGMPRAGC